MLSRVRKCLALLTPRERGRWVLLVPLALVAAALEALGAAAVFALIKLVGDPSAAANMPIVASLQHAFGVRMTVPIAALAVGVFYLFKNVILTAIAAVQSRVIGDSVVSVSRRMLQGYLRLPFVDHVRRNSAELIRNSTYSVQTAFREVMEPAFGAVTEAGIAAAIILVLMLKAPLLTLVAGGVLTTVLLTLLTFTRHTIARWGRAEQELRGRLLQTLQQTLHGVKEIKLRGRESFYYDSFSDRQRELAHVQHLNTIWSTASRLLIETVFICGVLVVIVVAAVRNTVGPDVVPLLGLYAYAGFRVIPSINRILMYLGRIQYGSAAVDAVYDDHATFRRLPSPAAAAAEPAIAFNDRLALTRVSFAYDASPPALQDISLVVRRGESVGIVGQTGAGKSTLIDVILGLLQPAAGHVTVDGIDISTALRSWQARIGYVPQTIYLMDDTLRRNVAFGVSDAEIDEDQLRAALHLAQLERVIASLPHGLDTIVGERGARLSGGERQRVAIARALYHQPELLVFDEATAALDSQTERELTRAIESLRGRKTLLIIAHRLSTVRCCDRLVVLRRGSIEAQGSFDELLQSSEQFRTLALAESGAL